MILLPQWFLAFFRKMPSDLDADFEIKIRKGRVVKFRKMDDWDEQTFYRRFKEEAPEGAIHDRTVNVCNGQ